LISQQATSSFKNKEAKVSIFQAEEKRLRQLNGPKDHLSYKIKMNDEVICDQSVVTAATARAASKSPGKLHTGITLE